MSFKPYVATAEVILRKAFFIWLTTAFFYLYQFVIRVSPTVFANDMQADLGVDACVLGGIISLYYWGYAGMQVPAGILLDRIGVRRPLSICCLMLAGGALIFSLTYDPYLLSAARLLMGIGSAFGFISNVKVGSLWFPPQRLSLIIGFTLFFGTMGAVFGNDPLARLVTIMGWRDAMMIIAAVGFLMGALCWLIIEDRSLEIVEKTLRSPAQEAREILHSVLQILKNPMTWVLGIYGLLMYLPLAGFADLWGNSYLQSTYHLDRITAASLVSWFYVGVGLGSPLWPFVLTATKNYRLTLMLSAALTFCLFSYVLYGTTLSFIYLASLLFLTGVAAGGQFIAFVVVTDINTHARTATASGTHNMLCMLSGIIAQPLIGYFIDRHALRDCALEEQLYSPEAYVNGLSVISIGLFLAVISCLFIKKIKYLGGEQA